VRVLLVDDHELVAETLAVSLRAEGIDVARCVSIESDAVLASIEEHNPTLLVLDLHLGGRTALPLIGPAIERGCRVVMLTGETDNVRLAECVEAGASGVLSKSAPFERLLDELHRAARGEELLSVGQREEFAAALRDERTERERRLAPFAALTAKEQAVLAALIEGRSAVQIARDALVSLSTVRAQIAAVLSKLGVNSQLSAVAAARAADWHPTA
jgi:DNA-binding NarL/FixJ family response regulator